MDQCICVMYAANTQLYPQSVIHDSQCSFVIKCCLQISIVGGFLLVAVGHVS